MNKIESSKILPMKKVDIRGFSHQAALLSILMAYDQCKPWICNNFIQIFSLKNLSSSWRSGTVDFFYMDYDDFRNYEFTANPWIRWFEIPVQLIYNSQFNIIDFIIENIKRDYYLYIEIDTYYIPYYSDYQKKHRIHWMYVYGFDAEKSTINCLDNFAGGIFKMKNIETKYIQEGFNGSWINYEKQLKNEKELSKEDKIGPSIGLFQVIPYNEEKDNSEIYKLNIPRITCLLKNYLSRTEQLMQYRYSEYYIYGISVYNELIKFTTTGWSADKLVDVRGFCSMRDHKALMLWRLRFLQEERKIDLEEIIEGYMEIYELMSKSIMIIVKHNYSAIRKQKSLEYVEKYLKKCEKQEELLLIRLIEVLNSVID